MVSRAKAKRGEQTHTPQLCNGGTIVYIELIRPQLWRMFLMLPKAVASPIKKAEQEQKKQQFKTNKHQKQKKDD